MHFDPPGSSAVGWVAKQTGWEALQYVDSSSSQPSIFSDSVELPPQSWSLAAVCAKTVCAKIIIWPKTTFLLIFVRCCCWWWWWCWLLMPGFSGHLNSIYGRLHPFCLRVEDNVGFAPMNFNRLPNLSQQRAPECSGHFELKSRFISNSLRVVFFHSSRCFANALLLSPLSIESRCYFFLT